MKEEYGNNTEFSEYGKFELEEYQDGTHFQVLGDRISSSSSSSSNPAPPIPLSRPSTSGSLKKALCSVKVVRADLDASGRPSNIMQYNVSIHVNIYKEEDANVDYILAKATGELGDDNMMLVNSAGLVYYNQEGTKGRFTFKIHLLLVDLHLVTLSFIPDLIEYRQFFELNIC